MAGKLKNKKNKIMKATKSILLIAFAMICNGTIQAQDEPVETPKNKVKVTISGANGVEVSKGEKQIIGKKNKRKDNDRLSSTLGFDLGFNSFAPLASSTVAPYTIANATPAITGQPGKENSLTLNNSKSINVSLSPFMYSIHLYKKSVNLITGLGVNWFNYRFDNDISFTRLKDSTGNITTEAGLLYNTNATEQKKTKVACSYVTMPFMLQFKPKLGRNRLVLGGGVSAGYLLKGWYKSKSKDGDIEKEKISFAFNPWQVNAIGEIGIDNRIRIYGSYGITDMFKTPVALRPVTVGIRFFGL
jgi:Outer membrane protein beta-barrel domain